LERIENLLNGTSDLCKIWCRWQK